VMQKGNWNDQQWKLSTHAATAGARLSCRFNGSLGAVHVFTSPAVIATDGSWHQVACVRVGNTVRVQVDGVTVAQQSGQIGSVSSTKPYLIGSKGVAVSDPDQYLGLLDDAFVTRDDGSSPPANRPPTARLDVTCSALSCTFDASTSSDPDGDPLSYAWDFGDGTAAAGSTVDHAYASAGTYLVQVDARDTSGATSVASTTVNVTEATASALAFRGVSGTSINGKAVSPQIPATTQPGDALLLFVSANRSDATLQGPAGWQSLGRQVDDSMQSQVWVRVAQTGDAGSAAPVAISAYTKMTAHVMAYSGANPLTPIASFASIGEARKSTSHTTPVVSASPTSWVVSMWADKSSSTTGWTPPASVTARQYLGTSGSGHVTSLVADSSGPIGGSPAGGLTATASQSGSTATMWTVVLAPAG
ncbi:MAG: PKD domain-containing protein, partial [Actinomycetes bacterium]